MIGGLAYEDFAQMWLWYENANATQSEIDKEWRTWCREHRKGK